MVLHVIAQLSLGSIVVLAVGCGSGDDTKEGGTKEERAPSPKVEVQNPPQSPTEAEALISLERIGLVDKALHREPTKDDWQGEVFNDLASAQLKALGKILEHPETLSDENVAQFATATFRKGSLVPTKLEVVFEDEALVVHRASPTSLDSLPAQSLGSALSELVKPLASATDVRTEFKIFSVGLDAGGEPTSEAYFQISGTTPAGIVSRRAKWRCAWEWPSPKEKPVLRSIAFSDFEQTRGKSTSGGEPLFADCTGSVFGGVDTFDAQFNRGMDHWAARLESRYGISLSGWHGLALGDVNGDGLDDLYVCEPGGLPNRLFIAKNDGTVIDASAPSETDFRLQTQSALFIDLDNDADQDLVIATTLGVIFMANDGRGKFAVKANRFVPEAPPMSLSAADFDRDGDLDVYVGCYSLRSSSLRSDGTQILGRPIPYHDANNGGRNVLFRNDRNWRFTDATNKLGLNQNGRRFTLAASWEDYDDDGDPDLYVANDYGRNNLYRNESMPDGQIRFVDVAKEAGVEDISAGMSVSWADADNDGDRDLYVSNMWSSAGNRIAYQRNFLSGAAEASRAEFQRHARGNSLFVNNGDGTFRDASLEAGVAMGRWAWGSRFADINNDGWEDIFVANGFITQPGDSGDL